MVWEKINAEYLSIDTDDLVGADIPAASAGDVIQKASGGGLELAAGGGGSGAVTDSGSNNPDGGDIYNLPAVADSLDTRDGQIRSTGIEEAFDNTTQVAVNGRPLYTTDSVTLYCDPVNGDDSLATENVDADNPLQTLNEAMTRIPQILYHEFTIDLAGANTIGSFPVTYDSVTAMSGPPLILSTWDTTGVVPALHILGDVTTPSNVVVDTEFNLAIQDAETDDPGAEAVIAGIQFDDAFNNKGGLMSISDCIFTGANTNVAIAGKAGGKTHVYDTEFQSGLDHAVDLGNIGAEAQLTNCSGVVSQQVLDLERGAAAYMNLAGNTPAGNEGTFDINNGGRFYDDQGRLWPAFEQVVDDFDDGRLFQNRVSGDSHFYRIEWEIQNGSPTGNRVDGVAEFPAGDTTSQQLRYSDLPNRFGEWEVDVKFPNSAPTSGRFLIYANGFGAPDRNGWHYEINGDGSINVDKWDSQTETADVITSTWTPDTSWHSMRLTNDGAGGIEAFFDGTSIGTHSSSALNLQANLLIVNETDVEAWADNVYVS